MCLKCLFLNKKIVTSYFGHLLNDLQYVHIYHSIYFTLKNGLCLCEVTVDKNPE